MDNSWITACGHAAVNKEDKVTALVLPNELI